MDKRVIKWDSYSVDLNAFLTYTLANIPSLFLYPNFITQTTLSNIVFDDGIDNFKKSMGLTEQYIATQMKSTVALESYITITNWVISNQLVIKTRASKFDGRKVLMEQHIHSEDKLLVTQTTLSISFDIVKKKKLLF